MAQRIADYLADYKVRLTDDLDPPILEATFDTGTGVEGSTRYEYAASYKTIVGETTLSETAIVINGNVSLSGFNRIFLNIGSAPSLATHVRFWKNLFTYITSAVRANSTAYLEGDYVVLSNPNILRYQCTTGGTTASSLPSGFPTVVGETITDGTAVWTCVTNQSNNWRLLSEVAASTGRMYDTGAITPTAVAIPTENTSGRPDVIAIMPKPATFHQRQSWSDLMSLVSDMVQDIGDITHKNGDVKEGCKEYFISGTTWGFTSGRVYFLGRYVSVPAGEITLVGTGTEKVGLSVTPVYSTPSDDTVQRCAADEGCDPMYASTGPDWLYLSLSWVKDQDGQLDIKEFYNNSPKKETLAPERSEMDVYFADKIRDFAGEFVVDKFPLEVQTNPDSSKLTLKIKRGIAYPNGYKTVIEGSRDLTFDKARETRSVNASILGQFSAVGAVNEWKYWGAATVVALNEIRVPSVINNCRYECTSRTNNNGYKTANAEPIWPTTENETVVDGDITWTCLGNSYDMSGKSLSVTCGSGGTHVVSFVSNGMTAAAVVAAIENAVNASSSLVDGTASGSILQLRALDAKTLGLTGTALAELGWISGTTLPSGSLVYPIGTGFVATVSDLSYQTEVVLQRTRSTTLSRDYLVENVGSIIGASNTFASCHDGIFDYEINDDFIHDTVNYRDYISFDGVSGTPPTPGNVYFIKCRINYTATKGVRQLVKVSNAQITKTGEDLPDNLSFTGATITRVSDPTITLSLSGSPKDVVRILNVRSDIDETESQYSSYTLISNSTGRGHDTSQVGWAGAGTPGTLGTGQPANSTVYYVDFEMWYHQTEGDFVSADSYDLYERINTYSTLTLRDCIDFRTTSGVLPVPYYNTVLDFTHYLPRIDKLLLDDFGNFYLVKGQAAVKPTIPNDQADRLSIAILRIAPYTYGPSWVTVVSVEPTVIRQDSLRNVLKRLDNLEYWKAVTDLEQEVAFSSVASDAVGIYTNALTGFNKFDLGFNKNGVQHSVALDINKQCLLLPATPDMRELSIDMVNVGQPGYSEGIRKVGNTYMIDYDPVLFLSQPYATESVNCAMDYDYDSYRGTLTLSPSSDSFMDTEQLPTVNIDFDNNLQALIDALVDQGALKLNELIWSNWNTSYTNNIWNTLANTAAGNAYWYDSTTGEYQSGNIVYGWGDRDAAFEAYYAYTPNRDYRGADSRGSTTQRRWRDGVYNSLIPGVNTESLGQSVVSLAMVGQARTKLSDGSDFVIRVEVMNLMPNQDHAITVSGVPVNFVYDTTPTGGTARGSAGDVGHTYQGCATVKADNSGRLTGKFVMPAGITAGNIAIEVFHYSDAETSNASGYFNSAGYTQKTRETTVGIPSYSYCSTPYHEEETRTVYHTYYDPLAQTFVVYDRIRYISQIGVFFRRKHASLPVRLEVRNTVNGQPGPVILASSIKESSAVTVSEKATEETVFTLDSVIGYSKDAEFSLVLFPALNNTDYEAWTAKVGGTDVSTGVMVTGQTNDGVLFHSPNNRVWEPMTKQDLKFNLYESNFRDNSAFIFERLSGVRAAAFVTAVDEFCGAGTDIKWFYSVDGLGTTDLDKEWHPFYPNVDTYMQSIVTNSDEIHVDLKAMVTSLGGSYQMLSPYSGIVFMLHKSSGWAVMPNEDYPDPLDYPNTVKCYLDLDTDITGPLGAQTVRSVTPYYSHDDGETLIEIEQDTAYEAVIQADPYYKYLFSTPVPATIETVVGNGSSVIVTATNHKFKDNAKVMLGSVSGFSAVNNVAYIVGDATSNTFKLYHPDTREAIALTGSGTGGTVEMTDISRLRGFLKFETGNQVRTPRVMNIAFVTSRV